MRATTVTDTYHETKTRFAWVGEVQNERLQSGLEKLSDDDLELLTLYVYEGYNTVELSKVYGIAQQNISKRINDEKALQHQLKQLTRKERTHRLCTRGGMLESFLQEPERLTDDDVMLLLKLIFHRQDTQELLKKLLEREKPETP